MAPDQDPGRRDLRVIQGAFLVVGVLGLLSAVAFWVLSFVEGDGRYELGAILLILTLLLVPTYLLVSHDLRRRLGGTITTHDRPPAPSAADSGSDNWSSSDPGASSRTGFARTGSSSTGRWPGD